MIELYYWPTPNGHKTTLFVEETGLDYTINPISNSTRLHEGRALFRTPRGN